MRAVFLAGAAAFLTALPSAAEADWQGTRWDMTRVQLAAVEDVELVDGDEDTSVLGVPLGARGRYEAMGFGFESQFYFNARDQLRVVRLMLTDTDRCADLLGALEGIYGLSRRSTEISTTWVDVRNGDRVQFTDLDMRGVPRQCFVVYSPLQPAERQGL